MWICRQCKKKTWKLFAWHIFQTVMHLWHFFIFRVFEIFFSQAFSIEGHLEEMNKQCLTFHLCRSTLQNQWQTHTMYILLLYMVWTLMTTPASDVTGCRHRLVHSIGVYYPSSLSLILLFIGFFWHFSCKNRRLAIC